MLPQKLSFYGILSYRESPEITIDFQQLTEQGLFGIFGPTGAGKSAILDAITLALFGASDRSQGTRSVSMDDVVNVYAPKAAVDLTFTAQQHTYRVRREWKRSKSRDTGELGPANPDGYRAWKNGQPAGIDKKTQLDEFLAEPLNGLEFEQFTQAVILPQGKFSRFLRAKPSDRINILEGLFKLHRFDLSEQIKAYRNKLNEWHSLTQGQLQTYADATGEKLQEEETQLKTLKNKQQQEQAAQNQKQEQLKTLEKGFEQSESYRKLLAEQKELAARAPQMENLRKQLALVEHVKQVADSYEYLAQQRKELQQRDESLAKLAQDIPQQEKTLADATSAYNKVEAERKAFQETYPERLTALQELKSRAIQLKEAKTKLTENKTALDKLQKTLQQEQQNAHNQEEQVKKENKNFSHKAEELKKLKKEQEELTPWLRFRNEIARLQQNEKAIQELNASLKQKRDRQDEIRAAIAQKMAEFFHLRYNPEKAATRQLDSYATICDTKVEELQQELQQVQIEEEVATMHTRLEPGQPCPVCGSAHHPNPQQPENLPKLKQRRKALQVKLDRGRDTLKKIKDARVVVDEQERTLLEVKTRVESDETALKKTQGDTDAARDALGDAGRAHSVEELTQFLANYDALDNRRQKLDTQVEQLRQSKEQAEKKLTAVQQQIKVTETSLQERKNVFDQEQNTYQEQEKAYNTKAAEHLQENQTPESALAALENEQKRLDQELEKQKKEHQTIEQALNRLKTQQESEQKERSATEKNLGTAQERFERKLAEAAFNSEEEFRAAQENQPDAPEKLTAELEAYEKQVQENEYQRKNLEEALKGKLVESAELEAARAANEAAREALEATNKELHQRELQLNNLRKQLREKTILQEKLEQQHTALDKVNHLDNLVGGRKLKVFVARYLMQQVCKRASERLGKFTNHRYALHVEGDDPEKLEFKITDILNGGQARSTGNLSGGETFLVALSLSLGLTEQLQSADASGFFFLDEGFGSLDKASVERVMNVLEQLRETEKRSIGLITHVGEIQEWLQEYPHLWVEPGTEENPGSRIRAVNVGYGQ